MCVCVCMYMLQYSIKHYINNELGKWEECEHVRVWRAHACVHAQVTCKKLASTYIVWYIGTWMHDNE